MKVSDHMSTLTTIHQSDRVEHKNCQSGLAGMPEESRSDRISSVRIPRASRNSWDNVRDGIDETRDGGDFTGGSASKMKALRVTCVNYT